MLVHLITMQTIIPPAPHQTPTRPPIHTAVPAAWRGAKPEFLSMRLPHAALHWGEPVLARAFTVEEPKTRKLAFQTSRPSGVFLPFMDLEQYPWLEADVLGTALVG